jgi:hypothetical protein
MTKDDDNNDGDNKIVGKWYLSEINNSGALNLQVNNCNAQSFIDFKADKTATTEYYIETDGICSLESSDTSDWSGNEGEKYSFFVPVENIGKLSGTVSYNSDYTEFTFYPDVFETQGTNIVFVKK